MTKHGLSAERLLGLRRVEGLQVSPCGSWMAVEVKRLSDDGAKYISDLWRVSVDPAGAARQRGADRPEPVGQQHRRQDRLDQGERGRGRVERGRV